MRKITIFRQSFRGLVAAALLLLSSSGYAQYCTPALSEGCGLDDDVNSFILNGEGGTAFNDVNTGCSPGAYNNRTSLPAVSLAQGITYNATVSSEYNDGGFDGDYCTIWIDFNNNFTFESSEMVAAYNNFLELSGSEVPIVIPAAAPLGNHRMRVLVAYPYDAFFDPLQAEDFVPCGDPDNTEYGEFHDYTINIVAPPACVAPTNLSVAAGTNSASVSWTGTGNFILEYGAPGFTPGTGATAGVGGTIINPAVSPQNIAGLSLSTNYRVYVRKNCTSTSAGFSSNSGINFTTIPPNDAPCDAIALVIDGAESCGNTATATAVGDPDISSCSSPNNTVWYKFTAATNGQLQVTMTTPATGDALEAWVFLYESGGGCLPSGFTSVTFPEGECQEGTNGTNSDTKTFFTGSLTAGTEYYVLIDGQSGDVGEYCISLSTPPPPPACVSNIGPADGSTNVALQYLPPVFSWDASPGATAYDLYLGATAATAVNIGSTGGTSIAVTGLEYSTTYFWYIVPTNGSLEGIGCIANATSFTTEAAPPAPANNDCANATGLTVNNGFTATPMVGTTAAATLDANIPASSCATSATPMNDVWYTVTVPATGNLIIQTSAMNVYFDDYILNVYSGTCGSLTEIACNDDGNPEDDGPSGAHSRVALTGLTPNATLYVRVRPYSINEVGPFAIAAWDQTTSVLPPVAPSGNCIAATPVTVNAANGNLYRWVPIQDGSGNIIAEIYPAGNELGQINSSLYVNAGAVRQSNGVYYLDRNVTITPATQPTSDVKVRMYLLASELTALQAADPAVTGLSSLNFSKNNDPCQSAVSGATSQFTQTGNATYGNNGGYAQFNTPSFSSLFARGGSTPLPVALAMISATNEGSHNRVNWSTAKEDRGDYFELERSADSKNFTFLAKIDAKGMASDYTYRDLAPVNGTSYYRLRVTNNEGKSSYSKVVSAKLNNQQTFTIDAVPNPVSHMLKITISGGDSNGSVALSDITGKILRTYPVSGTEVNMDMSSFAKGVYLVKYSDGVHTQTIKVSKQ